MRAFLPLFLIFLTVAAAGCTSPQAYRSGRRGFFDELGRLPSANGAGRAGSGRSVAARSLDDGDDDEESKGTRAEFDSRRAEQFKKVGLRWPLKKVRVTSPFGQRGSDFHEGVDLQAKAGTSVFAAHPGTVLYAGSRIRGYGRMVIVRHTTGLSTVYAHNSRVLVKAGQKIRRGQRIAVSGNTGHTSGPHLHFEVRDGTNAVDPVRVLSGKPRSKLEA